MSLAQQLGGLGIAQYQQLMNQQIAGTQFIAGYSYPAGIVNCEKGNCGTSYNAQPEELKLLLLGDSE